MSYRIDPNPRFSATVSVRQPGSGETAGTFKAEFRALTTDEFNSFDLATPEGTAEFLRKAWIGAEEVEDENGKKLAWSDELRDRLMAIANVRTGVVRAYITAFSEHQQGN